MATAAYQHEWYLRHKDAHVVRGKQRYQEHKAEISTIGKRQYWKNREYNLARNKVWRQAHVAQRLLTAAKSRAKRLGLPFDLCLEDIQIPEFCPVLGLKLAVSISGKSDSSPSLDRIIPALGYARGNVLVISWRANQIKSDATPLELRKIADFYQTLVGQR